jgi:hypothetical protein
MSTIVFIQVHERDGLFEAELPEDATHDHLHGVIAALGIELGQDTFIFIDEDEEPLERKDHEPLPKIKRGGRIHISKCRKIKVTVHFLEKTEEHAFAPGARVKKVKAWAVEKFKLDHHDAAEHVLQVCNSTDRPSTDTPLHELTKAPVCSMCFDLVPEKRVEG